jgi:hypothetical protein
LELSDIVCQKKEKELRELRKQLKQYDQQKEQIQLLIDNASKTTDDAFNKYEYDNKELERQLAIYKENENELLEEKQQMGLEISKL